MPKRLIGMIRWLLTIALLGASADGCGYPGSPAHASVAFSSENVVPGTVASYTCDNGFELLGPSRRVCAENGTWTPPGIPFCVLNVAVGKAPMQSSTAPGGFAQKAIDGSTSSTYNADTCSLTEQERAPWWYVNLLEPYMVQLVRIDFGRGCCANNIPATIVVRVGNNRPDVAANPICSRFIGPIEVGRPLFLPCSPPIPGAFVSIHLEGPPGNSLSICEAFVYTDQALPLESCPSFRDQPLGSTATFNGKCYVFFNNQPTTFFNARRSCEDRGGSLVDETSPVLQGFLSWELWQRHRSEPTGQYWMGATRDPRNPNNWKWINGNDVTISFWNLPGGNENCSRFDGTKGWLWSDTNCNLNLNFICQFRPLTCGHPEQPPNSTMTITSRDFTPSSSVQYMCDPGSLLIGPERRTCQTNGYYNEYPSMCRYLECGLPAEIPNGQYLLPNGTRYYQSIVRYKCDDGYMLVGRGDLLCDVDEKWDGPPPRCEAMGCPPPPPILNGYFSASTNMTVIGTTIQYFCRDATHVIDGPHTISCLAGGVWSDDAPTCKGTESNSAEGGLSLGGGGLLPQMLHPSVMDTSSSSPSINRVDPPSDRFVPISPPQQPWSPPEPPRIPDTPPPPPDMPPTPPPPGTSTPEEVVHFGFNFPKTTPSSTTTTSTTTRSTTTTTRSTTTTPTTTTPTTTPTTASTTTTTTTTARPTTTPTTTRSTTTTTPPPPIPTSQPITASTFVFLHSPGATSPLIPITPFVAMATSSRQPPVMSPSRRNDVVITEKTTQRITTTPTTTTVSEVGGTGDDTDATNSAEGSGRTLNASNTRLNTGGIIALSVFGGFVVLAAIITIIVIVYRRQRRPRGSMDNITISTYDSGSGSENGGGLNKYYKRAWDNLRADRGGLHHLGDPAEKHSSLGRQDTLDNPNYRHNPTGRVGSMEGMRDQNEMTVSDSAAWSSRRDRKHQRGHHENEPQWGYQNRNRQR